MQAGGIGVVGVVEDHGRTDLADRRRAETLDPRQFQDGFLVEVITAEMRVDIAQDRVVLDEGDDGVAGRRR